jgi:FixJ family two-component response regulator
MPGTIDGLGLAAWMRDHHSGVPIVIMSGFASVLDIEAINPAIVRIVAKPYRAREFAVWLGALKNGTLTDADDTSGTGSPSDAR